MVPTLSLSLSHHHLCLLYLTRALDWLSSSSLLLGTNAASYSSHMRPPPPPSSRTLSTPTVHQSRVMAGCSRVLSSFSLPIWIWHEEVTWGQHCPRVLASSSSSSSIFLSCTTTDVPPPFYSHAPELEMAVRRSLRLGKRRSSGWISWY